MKILSKLNLKIFKLLEALVKRMRRIRRKAAFEKSVPTEDDRALFLLIDDIVRVRQGFLRDEVSLDDLASKLCTNRNYVSRAIRTYKGMSYPEYINSVKLDYAMDVARQDPLGTRVTDMARAANYNYTTTFSQAFLRYTKILPSEWLNELRLEARQRQLKDGKK